MQLADIGVTAANVSFVCIADLCANRSECLVCAVVSNREADGTAPEGLGFKLER